MKASEYIAKLQELVDRFGDLDCVDTEDEPIGEPEYDNFEGEVFVLASHS